VRDGKNWLHHANVGYVFPDRNNVRYTAGPHEGRWSDIGTGSSDLVHKDVFKCWIDHGVRPSDAKYAYEVLPGATPQQTAERAADSPVQVLVNMPDLQAVYHAKLNLLAVAFWKPGRVRDVEVDRPCLLLLKGNTLAVSNPENQSGNVNVTLKGRTIDVKLPDGERAGLSTVVALP
jgi:hypothetical protein